VSSSPSLSPQKPKDLDFVQQKLTDKNLGFQMLQKMGWKEGHGLGSCGKGIREPVSVYGMGLWAGVRLGPRTPAPWLPWVEDACTSGLWGVCSVNKGCGCLHGSSLCRVHC
jgi:hypothetical protein